MSRSRNITVLFSLLLVGCMTASVFLLRQVDQLRTGATLQEVSVHFLAEAAEETEPWLQRIARGYLLDARRAIFRQQT